MADDRAYRIQLRYDAEDETFTALVPELSLARTAETRGEALALAEEAIDDRIRHAAEGEPLPLPIDTREVSGELTLKLAPGLHRELLAQASQANLPAEALAAQLVARALGHTQTQQRRPAPPRDQRGQEQTSERPRHPGGPGRREGYRPEMEDQAKFLEYVRQQESRGRGGRNRR